MLASKGPFSGAVELFIQRGVGVVDVGYGVSGGPLWRRLSFAPLDVHDEGGISALACGVNLSSRARYSILSSLEIALGLFVAAFALVL